MKFNTLVAIWTMQSAHAVLHAHHLNKRAGLWRNKNLGSSIEKCVLQNVRMRRQSLVCESSKSDQTSFVTSDMYEAWAFLEGKSEGFQ